MIILFVKQIVYSGLLFVGLEEALHIRDRFNYPEWVTILRVITCTLFSVLIFLSCMNIMKY